LGKIDSSSAYALAISHSNGEHQDLYLHGCACDVVKDTSDSNSLQDTLKLGEDPIGSYLAIPGNNESVPSYSAVFGQSTVGKCIFDHLVEPPLTGTASGNDESSMTMFSRDLVYMKSTFDPPVYLPTVRDKAHIIYDTKYTQLLVLQFLLIKAAGYT